MPFLQFVRGFSLWSQGVPRIRSYSPSSREWKVSVSLIDPIWYPKRATWLLDTAEPSASRTRSSACFFFIFSLSSLIS